MSRCYFEMFCNDCNGWILLNLNEGISGDFMIVCPNCGHEHPRTIKEGVMKEDNEVKVKGKSRIVINRGSISGTRERIVPMKSAYNKDSRLHALEKKRGGFLAEKWLEKATGERG